MESCQTVMDLIQELESSSQFISIQLKLLPIILITCLYAYVVYKLVKPKSLLRFFISVSFIFYLLNVFRLALMPMPINEEYIALLKLEVSCGLVESRRHNFTFFDYMKWGNLFHYTTIGNFFMLAPLGFYLPYLYRKQKWNIVRIFNYGFGISLSIECIQLLYSYITGYIYRGFNVDDLMLNTLGMLVFYIVYVIFKLIYKVVLVLCR
ncbi:MAG TPA: VanZ family protein [Firmicutes bacterium]|nr:VanZ family protein [Bacillota bacterium]